MVHQALAGTSELDAQSTRQSFLADFGDAGEHSLPKLYESESLFQTAPRKPPSYDLGLQAALDLVQQALSPQWQMEKVYLLLNHIHSMGATAQNRNLHLDLCDTLNALEGSCRTLMPSRWQQGLFKPFVPIHGFLSTLSMT